MALRIAGVVAGAAMILNGSILDQNKVSVGSGIMLGINVLAFIPLTNGVKNISVAVEDYTNQCD